MSIGKINYFKYILFFLLLGNSNLSAKIIVGKQKIPNSFQIAVQHFENNRYERVISLLKTYLIKSKDDDKWKLRAKYLLGKAFERNKQYNDAIREFSNLSKVDNYLLRDDCSYNHANLLLKLDKKQEAAELFSKIADRTSLPYIRLKALKQASSTYFSLGNYSASLSEINKIENKEPSVLLLQSKALLAQQNFSKAIVILRRIIIDNPISKVELAANKLFMNLIKKKRVSNKYSLTVVERIKRLEAFMNSHHYKSATLEAKKILQLGVNEKYRYNVTLTLVKALYKRQRFSEALRYINHIKHMPIKKNKAGDIILIKGLIAFEREHEKSFWNFYNKLRKNSSTSYQSYELGLHGVNGYLNRFEIKKANKLLETIQNNNIPESDRLNILWLKAWFSLLSNHFSESLFKFRKLKEISIGTSYYTRSLFWIANIHLKQRNKKEAEKILRKLAGKRPIDYYIARSNIILEDEFSIHKQINFHNSTATFDIKKYYSQDEERHIKESIGWQRMEEFYVMSLTRETIREMKRMVDKGNDTMLIHWKLSKIYLKQKNYRLAIFQLLIVYNKILKKDNSFNNKAFLKKLFPLNYIKEIKREAVQNHISPALIAAIILQESSFFSKANSHAGAIGLMQLMPSVGRWISHRLRFRSYRTPWLRNPSLNIKFGTYQLRWLMRLFKGESIYVISAYNAGRASILRWQKKLSIDDPDIFLELIPYNETKHFTKIVIRNFYTYKLLYSDFS